MKLSLKNILIKDELKKSFIQLISYYYPLTEKELTTYGSILSWRGISENRNIVWTENMFFEHLDKIDRFYFYHYAQLPWSKDFIDKAIASKHATWKHLMHNQALLEQPDLFAYTLPHWNKEDIWEFPEHRYTKKVIFGKKKYLEYEGIIQKSIEFNWKQWSAVDTFFWREEFIAENEEKWDWHLLSSNHYLPWSETFIARFKNKWDWSELSGNIALPWSKVLIQKFKDYIDWANLCVFIPISYELVKHFDQYWHWSHLDTMFSTDVEKYGDYVKAFFRNYQFPTYQEGDLNRILVKYTKNIIWFEFYEEYMMDPIFKGGIIQKIKWDIAFFNKVKDNIDLQYEEALIKHKSEKLHSRYKGKHWTYFRKHTYLDKALLEYLKVLESQKGGTCINWDSISSDSQLVADDNFLNLHFAQLSTTLLIHNKWFDWDKHFQKIKNQLTETDWKFISRNKKLDIPLIEKYREHLSWNDLAHNSHLSMAIIEYFESDWSDLNWYWLSRHSVSTPETVDTKYPWCWDGLLRYGVGLAKYLDRDLLHDFLQEVSNERKD